MPWGQSWEGHSRSNTGHVQRQEAQGQRIVWTRWLLYAERYALNPTKLRSVSAEGNIHYWKTTRGDMPIA